LSTLATLRDRVEADLRDTSNSEWTTGEIDAHIRTALRRFSLVSPQQLDTTMDAVDDQREYDFSSTSNVIEVFDVWYPYDSSDPDHPPNRPHWYLVKDDHIYLDSDDAPDDTYDLRIFYTAEHTIEDLDSATATTLSLQGENAVVLGATAYAAQQLAQDVINSVTVSQWTPRQIHEWAMSRMKAFNSVLDDIRRRAIISQDARVSWSADSRSEGSGGVV
jgi:hypothetical protein